jgi:hypothetical protein
MKLSVSRTPGTARILSFTSASSSSSSVHTTSQMRSNEPAVITT